MFRGMQTFKINSQIIPQILTGANNNDPTHQTYESGQAVFQDEGLHVLVIDRGESVEHGSIFPNSRFSEEGGREVVVGLSRFANAAQTHLVAIMSTKAASLKMIG